MNYVKKIVIALLAVVFLTSCGNNKNKIKLFPEDNCIEFSGDLEDNVVLSKNKPAILLIDNNYKRLKVNLEVELIKTANFNPEKYEYSLGIDVLDKDGKTIAEFEADNHYDKTNLLAIDNLKSLLTKNKGSKKSLDIEIQIKDENLNDEFKDLIHKAVYYNAYCNIYEDENYRENDDTSKNNDYENSNLIDETDWDKVLKDYEAYIDKYIALAKKAKNGDTSVLSEYASMMEKATDLQQSLSNAGGNLTPTQSAKFIKLQQKLTNAALEM